MAVWKTDNLVRVRNAIKNALIGAGVAKKNGNDLELLPPIVDRDFLSFFDEEDKPYMKAVMMEVYLEMFKRQAERT